MATLGQLREQAKKLGIPGRLIRGAETSDELQAIISDHQEHEDGGTTKPRKKSSTVRKASTVRKKQAPRKASSTKAPTTTSGNNYSRWSIPRLKAELSKRGISAGRGRPSAERYAALLEADDSGTPVKSKPKPRKAQTPVRKARTEQPVRKAKPKPTSDYSRKSISWLKKELASRGISAGRGRPSEARYIALLEEDDARGQRKAPTKAKPKGRTKPKPKGTKPRVQRTMQGNGGRHLIEGVNFRQTDGWNPRPGSAPDRIINELRKAKGNRETVFNVLKPEASKFVARVKTNGEKRSKAEMHEMLRYRISRTLWDFAMRTGQHEASDKRAEYGTAGTGEGVFKRRKKSPAKAKARR
jgi:hypothetical protein